MNAGQLREIVDDCVHCGFCLPACPTYQLWGEEMDSPRGRIHLIGQLLDGAGPSVTAAQHLDRCLGCMACVPACPSGVRYDRLIEAARSWPGTESAEPGLPVLPPRSRRDRAFRELIYATFPYPARLRLLLGPLRAAQRTGLDRLFTRSRLAARLSPGLAAALRVAPGPPVRPRPRGRLPERVQARGPRRATVGMLTGCVQQVFFPGVNAATARVLAAEGCDVVIPPGQGCCGALSLHTGRAAEAARFAKRAIAAFEDARVDVIVVNSAGCGSAMKEYAQLLKDDREDGQDWPRRAARAAAKVRDLSEFLAELADGSGGQMAVRHPLPVKAVYHEACHLGHAQGIRRQPRELLRAIPGLELAEVSDGGASLVVSANPGCSLQIASALGEPAGAAVPAVAHIAEVLDASFRGLTVEELTGG